MYSKILETIKMHKMIEEEDRIVLGLSGGADSVTLFYFLNHIKEKYNLKIVATHINHNIRGEESDLDEEFVCELCKKFNVEIKVFKFDILKIAKEHKITSEEAGRLKRYEAFNKVLKSENCNKIAVAHNKNDNVETVLMRIFRGTGLKGMAGIPYKRDEIIRPLMDISRDEIEKFCDENKIQYRIDKTNYELIYTRNKIRNEVIPYIEKEFNKEIINSISTMSSQILEENLYLDEITKEKKKNCVEEENGKVKIKVQEFLKLHNVIKNRLIRNAIFTVSKSLKDIGAEHIQLINKLAQKPTGKQINLPNGVIAEKEYNFIIIKKDVEKSIPFSYTIYFDEPIFIKEINKNILISNKKINFNTIVCTKTFGCDKIIKAFKLRSRLSGDKIFIESISGNKKIKDYFIDEKIPKDKRDSIPLLSIESDVLWIMDKKGITSSMYKKIQNPKNLFHVYLY